MKPIITLALACILAACATEVPAYHWHHTGASESDVSRQINVCKSQAQHDAKHGRELSLSPLIICRVSFY